MSGDQGDEYEREQQLERYYFTDRYAGDYPDPDTMCTGFCDGLGVYPLRVFNPHSEAEWLAVVDRLKAEGVSGDGLYFITCPACGGTGERPAPRAEA